MMEKKINVNLKVIIEERIVEEQQNNKNRRCTICKDSLEFECNSVPVRDKVGPIPFHRSVSHLA